MATEHRLAGQKEAIAVRRTQALQLRTTGKTYRAIAAELDCEVATVHGDVKASLRELAKKEEQLTRELRQLESERLDVALAAIWPKVEQGDPVAIDKMLAISKRRSALLGLDMPAKQEVSGIGGGVVVLKVVEHLAGQTSAGGLPNVVEEVVTCAEPRAGNNSAASGPASVPHE